MFKPSFAPGVVDRPLRELAEVEEQLNKVVLLAGCWHLGCRRSGKEWRVIIRIDDLDFDIATPGSYSTIESAQAVASELGYALGGTPGQQGGHA